MGGRWEQLSMGAATHLPFRAGHNWMHTAKAGRVGSFGSPRFLLCFKRNGNFLFFHVFPDKNPLKALKESVIM